MPEPSDKLSTTPKRPLKVFLCHAHSDQAAVRTLYASLVKDGVDVWLDKEKLLPGQDWELEIRKAVRDADVVVVCLSKQFNQAGFRQREVRLALETAMEQPEGEIFIIPARLEECDNLESLRKWHWVNLFEADGYEKLLRSLYMRAEKIGVIILPSFPTWIGLKRVEQKITRKEAATAVDDDNVVWQTTLEERRTELLEQEKRAIQYEHLGNKLEALRIYEEIKKSDILSYFPDIDTKISALKLELNSRDKPIPEKNILGRLVFWVKGIFATLIILAITPVLAIGALQGQYILFGSNHSITDYFGVILVWVTGLALIVWVWKRL